ncbi:hypothetical protein F5X99DRAFT_204034 [Biscogniauxia marginata]|nr:hypothetical protein F5X99DRAFT_204034 [Biscogniauxia marginata]
MGYRFPQHISAARIAAFVSTAAWLQGTGASEASLPEEALNNFLKRHEITGRQAPPPPPPEEEEDSVSEESDDDDASSADESSLGSEDVEDDLLAENVSADVLSGQPVIQSSEAPRLSPGAQAAIGIWVAVAVLAIGTFIFFVYRRRRKAKDVQEIRSLRDMEIVSYNQALSEKGGGPPPGLEPVHFRESPSRAPSGQWMATPPWQEDPPTWRESRPWRQSGPSVVGQNGLPLNQNSGVGGVPVGGRPEFDRRTEVTAETESTIFAYR